MNKGNDRDEEVRKGPVTDPTEKVTVVVFDDGVHVYPADDERAVAAYLEAIDSNLDAVKRTVPEGVLGRLRDAVCAEAPEATFHDHRSTSAVDERR